MFNNAQRYTQSTFTGVFEYTIQQTLLESPNIDFIRYLIWISLMWEYILECCHCGIATLTIMVAE